MERPCNEGEAEARLGALGLDLLTNWLMVSAENNCRGHREGTDPVWGPDRLEGGPQFLLWLCYDSQAAGRVLGACCVILPTDE